MLKKFTTLLGLVFAVMMLAAGLVHAAEGPANVETLAGVGNHGSLDGEEALFNMPHGIVSGSDGEIMVADTFNSLIRTIDSDGLVGTLNYRFPAFNVWGFPIGAHIDREVEEAFFNRPSGFAWAFADWLLVADTHNHAIRVIIRDRVYTVAGGFGGGFEDAAWLDARFSYPTALAFCASGYIYVADTGNHAIRRIDRLGNVTTVAGVPGEYGYHNDEAFAALFDTPMGLAICDEGRLFVADTGNNVIRVIENGQVSTLAGLRVAAEDEILDEWGNVAVGGFLDGDVSEALFNRPFGLVFWGDVLFVADSGNHAIRVVVDGSEVITIAGTGYPGYDDGDFAEAMFFHPSGLYVFGDMLLVADTGNNMIRRIDLVAVLDLLE